MSEKMLKSVNIWQNYKQECDCLVHFLHLLAVWWAGVQSARDNHALACNFAKYPPILKTNTHTHTRLMALFPGLPGWVGTRKVNQSGFHWSKRQWVAVASAGPYASLHLAPDRKPCQHPITQFFTGRMPFLPPNQQRQSTEGLRNSTWAQTKCVRMHV